MHLPEHPIRNFAMDMVVTHPPREVTVTNHDGDQFVGEIHYAGVNKFRLDTPLAACFFYYDEVESVK